MGKFSVNISNVEKVLGRWSIRRPSNELGRSIYSHIVDDKGCIIDDVIITRTSVEDYLCVSNAIYVDKLEKILKSDSNHENVQNITDDFILLAIQGPKSQEILQKLTLFDLGNLKKFRAAHISYSDNIPNGLSQSHMADKASEDIGAPSGLYEHANAPAPGLLTREQVPPETEGRGTGDLERSLRFDDESPNSISSITSRVGYTGEDGFEILIPTAAGSAIWRAILEAGGSDILPIGLGARDTLRLEKGYLLAGQDFDGNQTPLETGHERLIDWDHEFTGRESLLSQKGNVTKKLVGLIASDGRTVPRTGMQIWSEDKAIGNVTSGTVSPHLNRAIALGYVETKYSNPGTDLSVLVRGKHKGFRVKKPPFV
jgi:glycine cleavage system aminomethyltransferase T